MQTAPDRLKQALRVLRSRTGRPFELDKNQQGHRLVLGSREISPRGPSRLIAIWIEAYTDGWEDGRGHGVMSEYRR